MYSRKLQNLDFKNTEASLRALLRQINIVQEESEGEITSLITKYSSENNALRAELNALKDSVKALEGAK